MYSIGKLAKMFRISRTTLLYYDSIGLLRPSLRSEVGYRLYSAEDVERLGKISLYKEMGISLEEISTLIAAAESDIGQILMSRLGQLNDQIKGLRKQQSIVIGMLRDKDLLKNFLQVDSAMIKHLLNSPGALESDAVRWHIEFEKASPEQHEAFLRLVGLGEESIDYLREWIRDKA